jgi:hypothetical protein
MGRRVSVNYCMLCDSQPCQCSAQATKTAPKKKTLTAKVEPKPAPVRVVPKQQLTVFATDEDLLLNAAIRALAGAGLLSKFDRDKYQQVIDAVPNPDERAQTWRARRRLGNGASRQDGSS